MEKTYEKHKQDDAGRASDICPIIFANKRDYSNFIRWRGSSNLRPLSVGDEPVKNINKIKFSTGIFKVISATDCGKDRLAAYYFWNDQQSLNQAILVAKQNQIRISEIKTWSQTTRKMKEFEIFQKKLSTEK